MSERSFDLLRTLTPPVLAGVLLLSLPQFASTQYELGVYTSFCMNLTVLLGLNLISGYGGQISMGQGAFFGMGAYTVGILTVKHGWDPLLCFLLAPIVAAAFALLVGLPSLRLRGLYFAMATLGVGVVFVQFIDRATNVTGGPNGLAIAPLQVGGLDFSDPHTLYWLAAAIAWIGVIICEAFLRTGSGWGLRAAHASEPAASVVGVNTFGVRLLAFTIAGAFAGIAGAVEAQNSMYVSPTSFDFFASVMFFIVLAIGGWASWTGPFWAAGLMFVFDRWLSEYNRWEPIILAAIFLLCLRAFPGGIGYWVERVVGKGFHRLFDPRRPTPPSLEGEAG